MKTPLIYLAIILTGVLIAAETQKAEPEETNPDPVTGDAQALAKQAVDQQLVQRLTSRDRRMTRIGPIPPTVDYGTLVEVKGEKRLPFTVRQRRGLTLTGYVRLSDQVIMLTNTETMQSSPLLQHPAFKPEKVERIRP